MTVDEGQTILIHAVGDTSPRRIECGKPVDLLSRRALHDDGEVPDREQEGEKKFCFFRLGSMMWRSHDF